jgi:hypothetical protein
VQFLQNFCFLVLVQRPVMRIAVFRWPSMGILQEVHPPVFQRPITDVSEGGHCFNTPFGDPCGGDGIESGFKFDKILRVINMLSLLERGGVSNGESDRLGELVQQVHWPRRQYGTFCMGRRTKLFPSKRSIVEKTIMMDFQGIVKNDSGPLAGNYDGLQNELPTISQHRKDHKIFMRPK